MRLPKRTRQQVAEHKLEMRLLDWIDELKDLEVQLRALKHRAYETYRTCRPRLRWEKP